LSCDGSTWILSNRQFVKLEKGINLQQYVDNSIYKINLQQYVENSIYKIKPTNTLM